MNGLAASSPAATTCSVGAVLPARTKSHVCCVDSASTIAMATSPEAVTRPATTMSKLDWASWLTSGNATQSSPMRATRTPPTGPVNGRPASWVDSDAALIATTSYDLSGLSARTVTTTWTSLRRPLTKHGRSGRSMRRQVRIAPSLGRPSRRKNEPGILPAAYMRSSTSTVRGKKSMASRGLLWAVVAESSIVSSSR